MHGPVSRNKTNSVCKILYILRAAAPVADPGKMGKEETARLTFPICVCRVVYVCYIP